MVKNLYKKILLPTDGSEYSENAAKYAFAFAEATGAEIIAISVALNPFSAGFSKNTVNRVKDMLKEEAKNNLEKIEEIKNEINPDLKITSKVDQGAPTKVILDAVESEDIDIVIIGSSGRTGLSKFVMGSVAEGVVNNADCAVLVIR